MVSFHIRITLRKSRVLRSSRNSYHSSPCDSLLSPEKFWKSSERSYGEPPLPATGRRLCLQKVMKGMEPFLSLEVENFDPP